MKKQLFFLLLYCADVLALVLSSAAAFIFMSSYEFYMLQVRFVLFMLLILIVNYSYFNLYKDKRTLFDENELMSILYSILSTMFIIFGFLLVFGFDILYFITIVATLALTFILSSVFRFILHQIRYAFRKAGYDTLRVAFYGKDPEIVDKIRENRTLGYRIVLATDSIKKLRDILPRTDIVFVTNGIGEELLELMVKNRKINWKIISDALNLVMEPVDFDEFKDYPIINLSQGNPNPVSKRLFDIIVSFISLLALTPLFIFVAIMIKLTMPGPVFFTQERLGKDLRPFRLIKFRSMVVGADKKKKFMKNEVRGLFKMKDDPRITWFGKVLRRTCIDELPQLINILFGEMSIVGPRPHLRSELDHFKGWRRVRFRARPGLTGLWQVSGRHELNFDKAVLYDIYYVNHISLLQDITIILKTIPAILMSRGRF